LGEPFESFKWPWRHCVERECDAFGRHIWPPDITGPDGLPRARPARMIVRASKLRQHIRGWFDGRTRAGKRARLRLALAEKYERAVARARRRAHLDDAIEAHQRAGWSVELAFAESCRDLRVETPAGLAILARVYERCEAMGGKYRITANMHVIGPLINGILRMAGDARPAAGPFGDEVIAHPY
jgi:hypothetical protein